MKLFDLDIGDEFTLNNPSGEPYSSSFKVNSQPTFAMIDCRERDTGDMHMFYGAIQVTKIE